jgi:tetratricopeptide (TPR) repeat protein
MANEMLGNQYFMARDYIGAERELAPCLNISPDSKSIKRKLIICYTQIGEVSKALEMCSDLIRSDIKFIIDADEVLDDCPCPELINNNEHVYLNDASEDNYVILGILWLYCNVESSIKYLRKALDMDPHNKLLKSVLFYIEDFHNSQSHPH